MNEEGWAFKCKDCSSDDLYIESEYSITKELVDTLDCTCDEENDFAVKRTYAITTTYLERMSLDDEHRIGDVEDSEELDTVEEEIGYEVTCYRCLEDAHQNDWVTEVESSGIDEDSVEYYVRCGGCHREIEFGWSHPDRGGRIWPAECTDFNPWKSWPEPRYHSKWLEQGWIRPDLR